jgi:holo-[acyl-carrier protein] synthase
MRKSQESRHIVNWIAQRQGRQDKSLRAHGTLRIGVELVDVHEVASSLARFGNRYVRRVFTPRERTYCEAAVGRARAGRFAVRFAAKEAALKALRPGTYGTDWRSIEVCRHASGWCELVLHGEAAALASRQGINRLSLSMTRTAGCAVAVVVGQAQEFGEPR